MESHEHWVRQIDAELDGELSLPERAALAHHLAGCAHCAGARASHLELRVAIASAAGDPHARMVPRPVIRGRHLTLGVLLALLLGAALGWVAHQRWADRAGCSRTCVRRSTWPAKGIPLGLVSLLAASALTAQGPRYRVAYDVRVYRLGAGLTGELASGRVSGPPETALRVVLRTDSVEVEALLSAEPTEDTLMLTLTGDFFTRRRLGRSRRGLPLWEQDVYRRTERVAWGAAARIHPFGRPRPGADQSLWVQLTVTRAGAGGDTRPQEIVAPTTPGGGDVEVALEAVVRPRRARVALSLLRNDSVSAPRGIDLIPDAPPRRMDLRVGGVPARSLELDLVLPDPAQAERNRALALDADVVCLRVSVPATGDPARVVCGRLNNVARRLPLPTGDTLIVTFAWPAPR